MGESCFLKNAKFTFFTFSPHAWMGGAKYGIRVLASDMLNRSQAFIL